MALEQLFSTVAGIRAGLILVEDPQSSDSHEDWEPMDSFVDAGPSSIYVSVQPSVDGPVTIAVLDGDEVISGMQLYYEGELILDSKSCVVFDVDESFSFLVPCPSGSARIRIYADELGLASSIAVIFESR
ncbi:hypothetical protein [Actinomadura sp. NEAU-AAG7]|uniref:hypothetical protein n=1 Tax=Actinomadura sp. NEAU-AAG7 TaxID=2839640 RepID=UPI001BE3E610|nr:hypothetical protein [Actinomadura sp. NEAU-AAG7]MBT2209192.1 hypothetical protein [Actinomadura sp. NEAU-AAG7]